VRRMELAQDIRIWSNGGLCGDGDEPSGSLTAWNFQQTINYPRMILYNGICYYIVTCLQVILKPTCRVSGYLRQVIRVDAA
jgi:hypothetical protein